MYMKYSKKSLNLRMSIIVQLPVSEHMHMHMHKVPDRNVDFSYILCSNKRYQGPILPFKYDNWQLAPVRSINPVETMSHINSLVP